jgi:hypothetical protein
MEILRSFAPGGAAKSRLARLGLAGVLRSHLVQRRLQASDDEEQVRDAQRDFVSGSQHGKAHVCYSVRLSEYDPTSRPTMVRWVQFLGT